MQTKKYILVILSLILLSASWMKFQPLAVENKVEAATYNTSIQAWVYPGSPACSAINEYSDGRIIDVLKAEYYTVTATGAVTRRTVANDGCNAYSYTNAASVKAHSKAQYVTVSAGRDEMSLLVSTSTKRTNAINTLTSFVNTIGFTGIELDFEGFGQWSATDYSNYKLFVNQLGNTLHANGKKLMIDTPPIGNTTMQSYYKFKLEDFNTYPVDYLTVMAYDYQYDYGAGTPIAPNAWVKQIVTWTKSKITNIDKIVIGIPSYGYHGATDGWNITIDTYAQSKLMSGFSTATRDASSYEMHWSRNGVSYYYQDALSLKYKKALIESMGIKNVSVWHLGGNAWFAN